MEKDTEYNKDSHMLINVLFKYVNRQIQKKKNEQPEMNQTNNQYTKRITISDHTHSKKNQPVRKNTYEITVQKNNDKLEIIKIIDENSSLQKLNIIIPINDEVQFEPSNFQKSKPVISFQNQETFN